MTIIVNIIMYVIFSGAVETMLRNIAHALAIPLLLLAVGCDRSANTEEGHQLLNVSYDPTRELWRALNKAFVADYQKQTGIELKIEQSHGGSSRQARSVIEGLDADIVTLALWTDTEAIAKAGLINEGWQ